MNERKQKKGIHKAVILLLAAALSFSCLVGCGGNENDNNSLLPEEKYDIPVYDTSLSADIGGYGSPNRYAGTEQGIKEFAEAGYTVLGPNQLFIDFKTRPEFSLQMMDWAYEYGVKVVVADSAIMDRDNPTAEIDDSNVHLYEDHPAFFAFFIYDEPHVNLLNNPDFKDKIGEIKEIFPGKLLFINLNPMGAGGAGGSYELYIQALANTGGNFLSYDQYPLRTDGSLYNTYYYNLEMIRYAAADLGLYANDIFQAMGHNDIAKASVEMLRWQTANAMAYGYDMWSHYAYEAWHQDEKGEQFYSYEGERLPLYYRAQKANLEAQKWGHVYKSFNWQFTAAVMGEYGKTTPLFSALSRTQENLENADGIKSLTSDEPVLVGVFKDANQNDGFMVVNTSDPRVDNWVIFTPEFDDKYSGVMVWEKGESYIIDLDKNHKTTLELEPGEGKFLIPLKAKSK